MFAITFGQSASNVLTFSSPDEAAAYLYDKFGDKVLDNGNPLYIEAHGWMELAGYGEEFSTGEVLIRCLSDDDDI